MNTLCLILTSLCVLGTVEGHLRPEPKPWVFSWGPGHWPHDFAPYLNHPTHPHNQQWNPRYWSGKIPPDQPWHPNDWIEQKGSADVLLRQFYKNKILSDQYTFREVPILEVGPNFYRLNGRDKRRLMHFVDYIYGMTDEEPNMIYLKDWYSDRSIGIYTARGLQLQ